MAADAQIAAIVNPSVSTPATTTEDITNSSLTLGVGKAKQSRPWLNLLWSEWFAHSRMLLVVLVVWLAGVWFLPLVAPPLWILSLGIAFAVIAGPLFGGGDVIDGCEEFMLSFPPNRRQRFDARLVVGGGSLLVLTGMNLLALGLNLSDVLDRIFLNTGLIQEVQVRQPRMLYGLVVAMPWAIFALGFSMATLARDRTVAFTSWLWGSLVALGSLRMGLSLEEWRYDQLNGRLTVPLLVSVSIISLLAARTLYARKEAGADAAPLRIPLSWWGWLIALLAAGSAVVALLGWLIENLERML